MTETLRRDQDEPTDERQSRAYQRGREISAAMTAWDETRALLMQADRDTISAQPNPRAVPRELRRVIDALRRADRTRPAWVELSGIGDEPRASTWTERQLEQTRAQARRLRAALERAQAAAREARRGAPRGGYVQSIAEAVEAGATSILRPLSLAVATTTGPAQRGFGQALGGGLVIVAGLGLLFLWNR